MESDKTALALLDGERPSLALLKEFWNEAGLRVCADGAARTLRDYGLKPDVILGDLDSFPRSLKDHFKSVPILSMPDQNATDGEKAIHYCADQGFRSVNVLGALGKRTDHALYNLGLPNKDELRNLKITFYTEEDEIFLIRKKQTFFGKKGTRISLMPIFGKVEKAVSEGLLYPLKGETLKLGVHSSVSNAFANETASVDFSSGKLLVVIERKAIRGNDTAE